MKKYKTERVSHAVTATIKEVEVERETNSCIWISGRKVNKVSAWDSYHDTWDDAYAYLLEAAERHVVNARQNLEYHKGKLGNVKGMKKPE